MELIIEQVSRSKKLLQRHKVCGDTISIGRALDNDVVLSDPYVCARHLSVTCDEAGQWVVKDLDTVNGSFDESHQRLTQGRAIYSGDVIAIGKTRMRFIYPDQPVAPTIKLSGIEGMVNRLSSPSTLISVMFSYIMILVLGYYLQSATEIKATQMFSTVFVKVLLLSLLPALFALLARIFKHDARMLTQMVVCFGFSIVFVFLDLLNALLSFNSDWLWFNKGFDLLTMLVLVFSFFWISCYIAFHQSVVRRTIVASSITAGIFALTYLYQASELRDFNPKPSYNNTLLAPEFAWSSPVTIKAFISDSESVFEKSTKQINEKQ